MKIQLTSFARGTVTHVLSSRAFEQEYDLVNWRELVPVNTDYPEWASGVDFQIGDMTGAAQWQSGYSKDVPLADVRLISVSAQFAMYAVGYRYNVEEVGKAMFAGVPLTARKAIAVRQAADIFCAETALYGGEHPGWGGLANMVGVTSTASPDNGTGSARNWVERVEGNNENGKRRGCWYWRTNPWQIVR